MAQEEKAGERGEKDMGVERGKEEEIGLKAHIRRATSYFILAPTG